METPLYTALKRHLEKGRAPFHTPGHKGDLRALPEDLLHLDFTELPDTDSLSEACGPNRPMRAQRPPFGRADNGAFGAYPRLGDAVGFGGHAFGFYAHL